MFLSAEAFSYIIVNQASPEVAELKTTRRFGVGFSAGGPLGVFGIDMDVNLSEFLSLGGGFGTGFDYNSFMFKARYFILGTRVNPYIAFGFARWYSRTGIDDPKSVRPGLLVRNFLKGEDLSGHFAVNFLFPAIGVQYLHPWGFAVFGELYYFLKLNGIAHASYAGLGFHWYF